MTACKFCCSFWTSRQRTGDHADRLWDIVRDDWPFGGSSGALVFTRPTETTNDPHDPRVRAANETTAGFDVSPSLITFSKCKMVLLRSPRFVRMLICGDPSSGSAERA